MKQKIIITFLCVLSGLILIFWRSLSYPVIGIHPKEDFVLDQIRVFNPDRKNFSNLSLEFRNGRIFKIRKVHYGSSSEFSGMTATPGIVDMHAHLPPHNLLDLIPYFSLLYLSHGVTSVRIAGDIDGTAVPYARKGIEDGDFFGPRIFSCDAFVTSGIPRWKNSILVNSPEEASEAVRALKKKGADCIKSYENLNVPIIRALVETANKEGLPVIGHVPYGMTYEESKIPDVQHFFGIPRPASLKRDNVLNRGSDWNEVNEKLLNDIVKHSVKNKIANTPTLVASERILLFSDYEAAKEDSAVALMPRFYREVVWNPEIGIPAYRSIEKEYLQNHVQTAILKKKSLLLKLFRAGAALYLGSDAQQPFVVPGASLHQEMRLFQEAGIPSYDVWRMATVDANRAIRNETSFSIQEGASPDLLIFQEDPTNDLTKISSLYAVVSQGKLYLKKDLDFLVQEFRGQQSKFIFEQLSLFLGKLALEKQTKEFKH
ncbi:amidohydrolase family protein [Leptospira sp. 201903070]|uniref:Amidohydrolase family protein n=1 Tax=Leptospira ainlahdjerensis TaxID=2810033 RepID=A0ABS2UDQ5_9LEPT|nr:amidohydrolase family protein [Leptospira ainlahdjerensis]MBM9577055.1 amidohydrolase family protein [Leptospira ainlahdjerensis]